MFFLNKLFTKKIRKAKKHIKRSFMKKKGVQQKNILHMLFSRTQRREWERMRSIGFKNLWRVRRRQKNKHIYVDVKLLTYTEELISKRFSVGALSLHAESENMSNSALQIDLTEAGFLKFLIQISGSYQVLEVGTFRGWSTAIIAEALLANELENSMLYRHNSCIDKQLPQHETRTHSRELQTSETRLRHASFPIITTLELRPEEAMEAQILWNEHLDVITRSRINLLIGPADELMKILDIQNPCGRYNLIFIDADKSRYDIYLNYAKSLILPGGIIVIDNTLNAGLVATDAKDRTTISLKDLNIKIFDDNNGEFEPILIPAWDGITVIRRKDLRK